MLIFDMRMRKYGRERRKKEKKYSMESPGILLQKKYTRWLHRVLYIYTGTHRYAVYCCIIKLRERERVKWNGKKREWMKERITNILSERIRENAAVFTFSLFSSVSLSHSLRLFLFHNLVEIPTLNNNTHTIYNLIW